MANAGKKIKGGILFTIGFFLSPLSWWNDAFINLPIAFFFGWLFSLISEKLFTPMIIISYWLTNVLGFLLMHLGAKDMLVGADKKKTKKEMVKILITSIIYTLLILALIRFGILGFRFQLD
ncbi:hypothetical protein C4569_01730 [Candidatus Parcubacteria bacterium]|nr:MAG: hypothetical protein C4569_01730 [Candidatus Parcubacteria bacterium]